MGKLIDLLITPQFQVGTVILYGVPIVSLIIESQERLCLAQISNTLLKQFSYNEIHNRRVALGKSYFPNCTFLQTVTNRFPERNNLCAMHTSPTRDTPQSWSDASLIQTLRNDNQKRS